MEQKMIEMMDKLPELLNKLGEKLGVASAKIWEWSMLSVKIDIYQWMAWMLLWLSLVVVCIYCVKYCNKNRLPLVEKGYSYRSSSEEDDLEFYNVARVISGVLIFIFAIGVFICINQIIPLCINPEWYAFQNIMEQLSQLK